MEYQDANIFMYCYFMTLFVRVKIKNKLLHMARMNLDKLTNYFSIQHYKLSKIIDLHLKFC